MDFIRYPEAKGLDDVIAVLPHEEKNVQPGGASNSSPPALTIDDDDGPKKHSPNPKTLFNIYNPNLDHRDRGKHLRLPSPQKLQAAAVSTSPS